MDSSQSGLRQADFGGHLLDAAAEAKKRERTEAGLFKAGCDLLNRIALAQLTVSGICRQAGVAHGTFYLYFKDRQDFVASLLLRFVDYLQQEMRDASRSEKRDPERAATAAYLRLFEANPGLMKCLMNHLEEFPETRAAFQRLNREWAERVVQAVERRQAATAGRAKLPREELLRRAYALGAMVDQYLAALLLNKDETLIALSRDREALIDSLSLIWKRGMAA